MAQRLNAINVGYRPLNPADDVAGLAGQKQAVVEFEAKSADAARRAAADNARAANAIKSAQVSASAMNGMITAQNNLKKAEMQAETMRQEMSQRAWISEMELNQSQQQLNQKAALMPLEMEGMLLDQEAKRIDIKYASAEAEASIESKRADTDYKRNQADKFRQEQLDLVAVDSYRKATTDAVLRGENPWNVTPPSARSLTGNAQIKAVQGSFENASKAKENMAIAEKVGKVFSDVLDEGERNDLEAKSALGGWKYRNDSGMGWNTNGRKMLQRLDIQKTEVKLTDEEEQWLIDKHKDKGWYEVLPKGTFILTEDGISEMRGNREMAKPEYVIQKMVMKSDGTYTIEKVPLDKIRRDALKEKVKDFKESEEYELKPSGEKPEIPYQKFYQEVRTENGTPMGGRPIGDMLQEGAVIDPYSLDEDGNVKFWNSTPPATSEAPAGVTYDQIAAGQGNSLKPIPARGQRPTQGSEAVSGDIKTVTTPTDNRIHPVDAAFLTGVTPLLGPLAPMALLATSIGGSSQTHLTDATQSLTKNVPWSKDVTTMSKPQWDKGPFPYTEIIRGQITRAEGEQGGAYSDYRGDDGGLGGTEEEADILIGAIKEYSLNNSMQGGSDARQQVNNGIRHINDTEVQPHKETFAELTGMTNYFGKHSNREADELIATEFLDARVAKVETVMTGRESGPRIKWTGEERSLNYHKPIYEQREGKEITMEEFAALPAKDMVGWTLMLPLAHERHRQGAVPNAPTMGSIHDPARERFDKPYPLKITPEMATGAFKLNLEQLLAGSRKLRKLEKFIDRSKN